MEIDKVFSNDVDGVADNLFSAVKNSVSEIKAMQQRKAAENVQLVIQALKKIESDLQDKFDGVTTVIEKRVSTIKDGRDGLDGRNGRDGKDGRPGRDGAPGARGPAGVPGTNGRDGEDGVSVTDARIDFDGSLIISLSSGREINVGEVVAPDLAEKIKVITNGGGTSQSVLDSLASLQAQITALQNLGAVNYVGTWNASTNSPTITSGSGDKGDYYVVSVAGSTNIDGQTLWGVGDWIIFNGAVWQKVDGGSTGDFTNLSASGTVTFSGGTANGVAYLNGSKVLTTGSALTFDGSFYLGLTGAMKINSNGYKLRFYDATGATGYGYLYTDGTNFQFDSGNTQPLSFLINGTEGMRLTSTGLGIGMSSITYKLDVSVTGNNGIRTTSSAGQQTYLGNTGGESVVGTLNNYGFGIITNGSIRGYFDSSGNLTLASPGTFTYSSGTANGVAYLNGSKVLTTGSALTFDGTGKLGVGTTTPVSGVSAGFEAVGEIWATTASSNANQIRLSPSTSGANIIYSTYSGAGSYLPLAFNVSGSERARIDSSGRWFVGTTGVTTSSSQSGEVYSTGLTGFLFTNNTAGNYPLSVKNEGASGTRNLINFYEGTGGGTARGNIALDGSNNLALTAINALLFYAGNTERARITSGGYFKASNNGSYFGSTGAYHELRGDGTGRLFIFENYSASGAVGGRIHYSAQAPNNTGAEFLYCSDSVGERASIRSNGGLANYSANNVNLSDRREKTNFAPAKSYLDTICAIPVQTFNYIDQSEDDPGLTLGVIAQDVQAVAPELVMESNWGTEDNPKMRLSIYQTDLQYALMKALQELKSELDSVKAELATLKGA